jgi:hypothetical protein
MPALPLRVVALYLIVQSNDAGSNARKGSAVLWMKAVELITMMLPPFIRVRTRILHGSYVENMYSLMCLGLSPHTIPIDAAGNPKTDLFHYHLQLRQIYESGMQPQQQQLQPPPEAQQTFTFQHFYGGDHETHLILDDD